MNTSNKKSAEVCDHCAHSSCSNCNENYHDGMKNPSCCSGYHH